MIDENLKPWLIEVNACPSLTTTTDADLMLKMQVIDDMFKVVIPPDWGEDGKFGANQCQEKQVGGFNLLIDETRDPKKDVKGKIWR